jgi:SAM-dependent methyltransferase
LSDVFGKALMAYHRGGEMVHYIERDDVFLDPMETGYYFMSHEAWSEGEKASLMEVRGRVLDVGCGAGRTALLLQERGQPPSFVKIRIVFWESRASGSNSSCWVETNSPNSWNRRHGGLSGSTIQGRTTSLP